jgi:hypothetical protein
MHEHTTIPFPHPQLRTEDRMVKISKRLTLPEVTTLPCLAFHYGIDHTPRP